MNNLYPTIHQNSFIKLGEKKYMDSLFEKGEIYMNSLSFFQNAEENEDGRADKKENLSILFSGEGLKGAEITIKQNFENGCNETFITPSGGIISIEGQIQDNSSDNTHIYSVSVIDKNSISKNSTLIEPRNFAQGKDFAVLIYNPTEFINRVFCALDKKGIKRGKGKIEYIDENNHCGDVGIYRKYRKFAYQNEFRITAYCDDPNPLTIEIGSLCDIAFAPMPQDIFLNLKIK